MHVACTGSSRSPYHGPKANQREDPAFVKVAGVKRHSPKRIKKLRHAKPELLVQFRLWPTEDPHIRQQAFALWSVPVAESRHRPSPEDSELGILGLGA